MLVVDHGLKELIQRTSNPLLTDFDVPADWESRDSLVQPCSVDLHIGGIFQPGLKTGKRGTAGKPRSQLVLRTGQTAIVCTKETIHMPSDHAGFGFPPSHISSRALLMTNPGHIDPGYGGTLQFTVINMGREDYVLTAGNAVVTLLIFKLTEKVDADYAARRPNTPTATVIDQSDIDRLAQDFVNVNKRAEEIANRTYARASGLAAVLAVLLTWGVNAIEKKTDGVDDLKSRIARLEEQNSNLAKQLETSKEQMNDRIEVDHRLSALESETKRGGKKK